MKSCAWCSQEFDPKVKYQIYCSVECRELSTKDKISEKYQINRIKNRAGKIRKCSGGCGTSISIYNDNGFCGICMVNKRKVDQMLKELKGFFDYEQEN
jgi:hypothetical protein